MQCRFFNGDHCNDDDFHFTTPLHMREATVFWRQSDHDLAFVRWRKVDQSLGKVLGTVE